MSKITRLACPPGPGRLFWDVPAEPRAVLVLGHGAGGGVDAPDLGALAACLPERGIAVVRFEQPWRTAGRKVAPAPKQLDAAWAPALAAVAKKLPGMPLFQGGRSAGARVACRGATPATAGIVALSFPLHPPGRPEKSRAAELTSALCPTLVLQGAKDTFGTPAEIGRAVAGSAGIWVVTLPEVGHELKQPKRSTAEPGAVLGAVCAETVRFVDTILGAVPTRRTE